MAPSSLLLWSTFITLLCLFTLGASKKFFTSIKWYKGGAEFVVLGGMVALVSWSIGYGVDKLLESHEF